MFGIMESKMESAVKGLGFLHSGKKPLMNLQVSGVQRLTATDLAAFRALGSVGPKP